MMLLRHILQNSGTAKLSKCYNVSSFQIRHYFQNSSPLIFIHNHIGGSMKHITYETLSPVSYLHPMNHQLRFNSSQAQSDKDKLDLLCAQMNMRLLNENSFLSWCRNAYLSSVVGIAMMEEATSTLAHTAGFGAFMVGGMNVFWGTSCHIVNLTRLRHATGMSGPTLAMHVLGSLFHCMLWLFILVCYIGFLDDPDHKDRKKTEKDRDKAREESIRRQN